MILADISNKKEIWYVHYWQGMSIVWGKDKERAQVLDCRTLLPYLKFSKVKWRIMLGDYNQVGKPTAWNRHIGEHIAKLHEEGRI